MVDVDGRDGWLRLAAALDNSQSAREMDVAITDGLDNVANRGPILQQLESAIRGNTKLYYLLIQADSATKMLPLLDLLHLLAPLQELIIDTQGCSCTPLARSLSNILSHANSNAGKLSSLSFEAKFDGAFEPAWTAIRTSTRLDVVLFSNSTFDAANTKAFEDCFQNLESNDKIELTVGENCKFEGKKSAKVAADILVARKLKSLRFAVRPSSELNDIGFVEMVRTLERQWRTCVCLPQLMLEFVDTESANVLRDALPKLTNLRDVSIDCCHPITQVQYAELKTGLVAATKNNGSLHWLEFEFMITSGTKDPKHYLARNKHVPELLERARKDENLRLLVPTLFAAALQAPRLASSTLVAALAMRKRVGPSEAAAAARMQAAASKALARKAATFVKVVSAMKSAVAQLTAAQAAVDATTANAAAAQAAITTAAQALASFLQTPEDMG